MDYLPALLRLVADELGLQSAYTLAREYGGQEIKIPKKINKKGELYERLDGDIMELLVEHYGGEKLLIPLGNTGTYKTIRSQIIKTIQTTNKSNNDLAKQFGVTRRTIINLRNKVKSTKEEPDLVDKMLGKVSQE